MSTTDNKALISTLRMMACVLDGIYAQAAAALEAAQQRYEIAEHDRIEAIDKWERRQVRIIELDAALKAAQATIERVKLLRNKVADEIENKFHRYSGRFLEDLNEALAPLSEAPPKECTCGYGDRAGWRHHVDCPKYIVYGLPDQPAQSEARCDTCDNFLPHHAPNCPDQSSLEPRRAVLTHALRRNRGVLRSHSKI